MLLPPAFVQGTVAREGTAGRIWLERLPTVIDALLDRWSCVRDGPVRHGRIAVVVPVSSPSGPAVIKVSFPHPGLASEAEALRLVDGTAAVRLHADAPDHSALLLERAEGPPLRSLGEPEAAVETMGDLAARLAVTAGPRMSTLADAAPGWSEQLDREAAQAPRGTIPAGSLQRAREAIELLAHDTTRTMLHGDLHDGNVLGAERESWLTIDLRGWAGTAAYDAFTAAMSPHVALTPLAEPTAVLRGLLRRFAATASVDPGLAVELAHARAMSSLLHETLTGVHNSGPVLLRRLSADPL